MIVSHDRYFLRHLSNRVFEIDRGSRRVYDAGCGEYLSKAIGRSPRVIVHTYSANPAFWWDPIKHRFEGELRLSVFHVSSRSARELARMADGTMNLRCSIQDSKIWLRDDSEGAVRVEMEQA